MFAQLRPAIICFLLLTLATGVIYPAVVTGIAKICFAKQAEGCLVERNGTAVGSELIAQGFSSNKYFWPRPSAAAYSGSGGSGSNLALSNPALIDAIKANALALHAADPQNSAPIPMELVSASASGLDPELSPPAMGYQVARVAAARGMTFDAVMAIVQRHTKPRLFGVLGEPTVNVLLTNLELDSNQSLQAEESSRSK